MKKISHIFLVFFIFFMFIVNIHAEEINISVIDYNGVFARKDAGSSSETLKYNKTEILLPLNHSVTIIDEEIIGNDEKWYKVEFIFRGLDYTGYIRSDLITTTVYTIDDDYGNQLTELGFPETYISKLKQLHALHPEWIFKPLNTNLNWDNSVTAQSQIGVSLIYYSRDPSYFSTHHNAYDWENDKWFGKDGNNWYAANEYSTAYYLDPRNFLTERNIFMFETLNYKSDVQTLDVIQDRLNNTFMSGSYKYMNKDEEIEITYAQTFIDAAIESRVNPIHIVSRVIQEQGVNGSAAVSGNPFTYKISTVTNAACTSAELQNGKCKDVTYSGLYNFFNIGAYPKSSTNVNDNWRRGLIYANGGITKTPASYSRPWDSRYKSIIGGAQFLANDYINLGQNTIYLQKFNVAPYYKINSSGASVNIREDAGTEYPNVVVNETNVTLKHDHLLTIINSKKDTNNDTWYYVEFLYEDEFHKGYVHSSLTKKAGTSAHTHQYMTNIEAPTSEASTMYNAYNSSGIIDSPFLFIIPVFDNMPEKTRLSSKLGNPNNLLKNISINDEPLLNFKNNIETYDYYVTMITDNINIDAEKVSTLSTIAGIGNIQLLEETTVVEIEVKAENGDIKTYVINIIKTEDLPVTVFDTIKYIGWNLKNDVINGIDPDKDIFNLKKEHHNIIINIKDKENNIKNTGNIGTGDIIEVTYNNETIVSSALLYGDVNGDGLIDGLDLLNMKKHLLEVTLLDGLYENAADITKNKTVDGLDYLLLKKYILDVSDIIQGE